MENTTYGFFDDARREYVITRPDTPLPWLNYLGQEELFGLCTHTGGGYTFWKDAKLRRLTRYRYNNMPMDVNGRILYVRDGDTIWNPGWKPVKTPLDRFECRHGLGYSRILGAKDGVEVELLFFIPPGETTEIWKTTVRNTGAVKKSITLFSFVEFCLFEALNDMTNYQRTYSIGEVEVEGSAIYHKTEYRERRNHYTLFGCTRAIDGFDIARDAFVGVHNGLHDAATPLRGRASNNSYCGWNPIGSHQINLDLAPGGEESFAFVLAYVDQGDAMKFERPMVMNKEKGRALMARYSAPGVVDAALARVHEVWDGHLGKLQADCPNEHLQRMVNIWNPAQCMATFNLSRSASGYETGIGRGMGYRDSNQDLLGFVHLIPSRARERILDIAATQLSDGTCYHQYQPLTKKGNAEIGGDFYDDHLWLIVSTCAYIRETGDRTILEAKVGYADVAEKTATLRDHLELSIAYTLRQRGPHGLPLIGHADWNDCLNLNCFSTEPNESFQTAGDVAGSQAESVMIAGLFLYAARDLAGLYDWLGESAEAGRVRGYYAEMLAAVEAHAWDGAWYRRAYDAEGRPVGSRENEEGQIYIESQGWCVLGGAGEENGRARKALASVHERLFTPNGVILQQPAYKTYHLELGEVSSYPPGFKENAGIFSHNNTWIQLAWCRMGEGDRALAYYLSICPSAKQDQIETYRAEPYVYAQMIAGRDAPTPGEAKNSWLTGTAAWSYVVATQGILGIQPDYNGLRMDPCLPREWPGFTATRVFRGATYHIRVENPNAVSRGVQRIEVDGHVVEDNLLPLAAPGTTVDVRVVMG
ncbi:MAG TPA: glycosyl transferase [Kiritimatiellia bacterium]|nr:glycosyl transferase [Kiritimatiellia bacterium]HMO99758.1 glycosyl transferase [Kiritimatiellia bacterium]HMP00029.1 glycosyl transferase [Kiritimatiellia bacterium]HMP97364.1 glycosyl transferase [Kiritimatiellia bacterium]